MTAIVGVHGIGNYHYHASAGSPGAAASQVSRVWTEALRSGLDVPGLEVRVAYYAHLLHRGTPQGGDDPAYLDDSAQDLLISWVSHLYPEGSAQGSRTARARAAAEWLSRNLGDQVLRFALRFVREADAYLRAGPRRQQVRDCVAEELARHRPRVVIAHSLGSVVAYETLHAHPEFAVDLLVTLGSPLAMPGVIFDRLEPRPDAGRGWRPAGTAAWANLADTGDIVAIPRTGLSPRFDGVTADDPAIVIDERAFHDVDRYLAAGQTADAVGRVLGVTGEREPGNRGPAPHP